MSAGSATFAGRWREAVTAVPDAVFLVWEGADGGVSQWTYAEFDRLVARVAGGLGARGVGPGSAIHLALANSPAFVAVWLASTQIGAWVIPSDPKSAEQELATQVKRTRPVVGVCAAERSDVYRRGAAGGPEVVEVDEGDTGVTALASAPVNWTDVRPPEPQDRAAVMFTSGTTSAPKGVVVTQANYAFAGDVMAAAASLGVDDRQLVVLPLFHANAQYYSFASAISSGASVALMPSFSASRFLTQAARHRATHASLFAAPMRMLLARGASSVDGCILRHVWYAQNVSDEQYVTLSELFGCRPRQLYGMTETIPAVLTNRALDPSPLSMGIETLGCSVDLRSQEDGSAVGVGEVGELVIGGVPGLTVFGGYLDDPDTTRASYRDGWFRSGDLASRDDQGRYFFAGRRGDVLKVAGENVSVVEVEAVLNAHPSVLEAAVVGEPDPIYDEVPVAYVVQHPGKPDLTSADVNVWCAQHLAPSKRPRRVEFVAELPRTSVGKIKKFLLKHETATATERIR